MWRLKAIKEARRATGAFLIQFKIGCWAGSNKDA
jgi:hypothetical protein